MRITRDEFAGYMKNWDEQTRRLLLARMDGRYRRETLEHFSAEEARILGAMLDRMIPQDFEEDRIDLVGFVDWSIDYPLGRGDRQQGMPPDDELFHQGLVGVQETARAMFKRDFPDLASQEQDEVLTAIQDGSAVGDTWLNLSSSHFFIRLMMKAVTGFFAHPFTWMRMGFPGPSYPEGYTWLGSQEIMQRRRHFPGWDTL